MKRMIRWIKSNKVAPKQSDANSADTFKTTLVKEDKW